MRKSIWIALFLSLYLTAGNALGEVKNPDTFTLAPVIDTLKPAPR